MHTQRTLEEPCPARQPVEAGARERGVRAVVVLTSVTMVVEIVAGSITGSMALLADGWHMATHVAALGFAALAYSLARRFADHPAFALGTGKVQALAGYTSAVALGLVALAMAGESVHRLVEPVTVDFDHSLPVAVLGLLVNLASVGLLHPSDGGHGHGHGHGHLDGVAHERDHNHRAALVHVIADTLTSGLAILALLSGRFLGWVWLDPLIGIVGAAVISKWAIDLCRGAAFELLDVDPSCEVQDEVCRRLERVDDVRVTDLHVWQLGSGRRSCIVTVETSQPRDVHVYRAQLTDLGLAHLTVEVRRCAGAHPHVADPH